MLKLPQLAAYLVAIIHTCIVVYVVAAPFVAGSNVTQRVLYFWVSTSIITHWMVGNSMCILTVIENKLRGVHSDESFIHRIVSNVYDLDKVLPNKKLRQAVHFVTVFLWWWNAINLARAVNWDWKHLLQALVLMDERAKKGNHN